LKPFGCAPFSDDDRLRGSGGCYADTRFSGIEPTDLSAIRIGASRAAIDAALGEPNETMPTCQSAKRTYLFDRGLPGDAGLAIYGAALLGYAMTGGLGAVYKRA
jgi:hypothetical protein